MDQILKISNMECNAIKGSLLLRWKSIEASRMYICLPGETISNWFIAVLNMMYWSFFLFKAEALLWKIIIKFCKQFIHWEQKGIKCTNCFFQDTAWIGMFVASIIGCCGPFCMGFMCAWFKTVDLFQLVNSPLLCRWSHLELEFWN